MFKTASKSAVFAACVLLGLHSVMAESQPGEAQAQKPRIGVYDSRVVACAHFWSAEHQRQLKDLIARAKEAKNSGRSDLFAKLDSELKRDQEQIHLQVFSTAPVDGILAAMKGRLAEVRKQTRVTRFVSKWDHASLAKAGAAPTLDVTSRLIAGFKLNEKQLKMIDDIRQKKPLSLEKATALMKQGKL